MKIQYRDIIGTALADVRDGIWVGRQLSVPQSGNEEAKPVAERIFALQCPLVVYNF